MYHDMFHQRLGHGACLACGVSHESVAPDSSSTPILCLSSLLPQFSKLARCYDIWFDLVVPACILINFHGHLVVQGINVVLLVFFMPFAAVLLLTKALKSIESHTLFAHNVTQAKQSGQPINPECPPSHQVRLISVRVPCFQILIVWNTLFRKRVQLKDGTPTGAGTALIPLACFIAWMFSSACFKHTFGQVLCQLLQSVWSFLTAQLASLLSHGSILPRKPLALQGQELVVVIAFTMVAVLIGFVDDRLTVNSRQAKGPRGIRAGTQFKMQCAVALALATVVNVMLPQPSVSVLALPSVLVSLPTWLYSALCAFTYVSMVNAVNFTDGLDGLATSCTALVFSTMAVVLVASSENVALVRSFKVLCAHVSHQ
jgi:UDP-N-acetylmuramyl pentapeptide phosphotransferase/UDP-N-acetylglucosamine-1-phosphate transferase